MFHRNKLFLFKKPLLDIETTLVDIELPKMDIESQLVDIEPPKVDIEP